MKNKNDAIIEDYTNAALQLKEDPMLAVELMAQSMSDTVEEEGVMYVSGSALTYLIPSTLFLKVMKEGSALKGVGKGGVANGKGGKDTGKFNHKPSRNNKIHISDNSLKHSNIGDFTTDPRTGDISKMKSGGHGQSNIEFLEKSNVDYNITKVYENGVRVGNVPGHKVRAKRTGSNQSWFPENWTESDISSAGAKVAESSKFANAKDGVAIFGEYNGVRVGVIKTNGEIGTIFPDSSKQP